MNYLLKNQLNGIDSTNFLLILENLNLSKTKKELDEITTKINKSELSPLQNVNYLGVVLDEFLSWDALVNNCVKSSAN